jgi:sugar lactone lactonase YvrE
MTALALFTFSVATALSQPTMLWETAGFKQPESVLYDAPRGVFYVSNVNGSPPEKDGNGYISMVAPGGIVVSEEWVAGLDAPKGMAIRGNLLYVSDIDQLVVIDVDAAQVVARYTAPSAKFLNDVAVDSAGRVYISDMLDDAIYRLDSGTFGVWLKDPALASPNGLLVEGDRLVVGAWGVRTDGFSTKVPGHLKTVAIDSKAISSLGAGNPVGNLDGVEADGQGSYLVTDWISGGLFRIAPSGFWEKLLDLNSGSADLEYIGQQKLAVIPMMNDGVVVGYELE